MSPENNWLKLLIRSSMGLSGLKSRLQQFLVSFWVSCSPFPHLHTGHGELGPSHTAISLTLHSVVTMCTGTHAVVHTHSFTFSVLPQLGKVLCFSRIMWLIETTQIIQNHFFISKSLMLQNPFCHLIQGFGHKYLKGPIILPITWVKKNMKYEVRVW